MKLKSSLIVLGSKAHDSPRSSIQILTAFFASLKFIHESDMISGELGGFHCSSIGSIVIGDVGCGDSVEEKVMVLMKNDGVDALKSRSQ